MIAAEHKCNLHDWSSLTCRLVFAYDGLIADGRANGNYLRHSEMSAWLVRQGHVWIEADGYSIEARAGQWVVCSGTRIRQKLSTDAELLSIRLRMEWSGCRPVFEGGPLCLFEARECPALEPLGMEVVKNFGKVTWGDFDVSYVYLWLARMDCRNYLSQCGNLHLWLAELAGVLIGKGWRLALPGGTEACLSRALFLIEKAACAPRFPKAEIHAMGGRCSPRQLDAACRRACGVSLHGYWQRLRVDAAKQALGPGRASAKEVASELGFTQLSHFSSWFKRNTGVAPRQFPGARENSAGGG